MKKIILSMGLIFISSLCFCQNIIDWQPDYKLVLSDFKSTATEINEELTTYSIQPGIKMDFSFHMSNYEFMFTKNFNSKVSTTFNKSASTIIAPNQNLASQLLRFAQFNFDLTELYSRKFRKALYEKKGAFSNASFFQPIYDEIQTEMTNRYSKVLKESKAGENKEVLDEAHRQVLTEIASLSEFCKDCKPQKRKKKKK